MSAEPCVSVTLAERINIGIIGIGGSKILRSFRY